MNHVRDPRPTPGRALRARPMPGLALRARPTPGLALRARPTPGLALRARPAPGPAGPRRVGRGPGRARRRLLGALAACLALACCAVRPPAALDLVDAGFRDPERTFRSFRAALAADVADLEYRCWSLQFRRDNQLSFFAYAEGREQLLESRPWLRLFANAEVEKSERLAPDLHRLEASVLGRRFEVLLVREDFYELWSEDGLVTDGDADWEASIEFLPGEAAQATIPLEPGIETDAVTELRLGREWKIEALGELEPETANPPSP